MAQTNSISNKSSELTIDPGASGDSFIQLDINNTGEFRIGVDDDAADAFKISSGSALGTNDTFVMTSAGERTMPLQPAFLANLTGNINNVTGDNTTYTVVWDQERFDQNNDFSSTTFTAPVTGLFLLSTGITIIALTTSHETFEVNIVTSNQTYAQLRSFQANQPQGNDCRMVSICADMDAGDTATVTVRVANNTKVIDISSGTYSFFSGYLVC